MTCSSSVVVGWRLKVLDVKLCVFASFSILKRFKEYFTKHSLHNVTDVSPQVGSCPESRPAVLAGRCPAGFRR